MNSIYLDSASNWSWHHLQALVYQKENCLAKIARAIASPLLALASFVSTSLIALRNRILPLGPPSDKDLIYEFDKLTQTPRTATTESALKHFGRNRYGNILPYDHTRVTLKDPNFYFNANWVLNGQAIASQGPLPNELDDFWKMIWETGPSIMVMLTNCDEGRPKCEKYWPFKGAQITTLCKEEKVLFTSKNKVSIVRRTFDIKKGSETKTITQLHLQNWPDHGAITPDTLAKLIEFTKNEKKAKGPLFAHCSAGVGRTGTFLAAYLAAQQKCRRIFSIIDATR